MENVVDFMGHHYCGSFVPFDNFSFHFKLDDYRLLGILARELDFDYAAPLRN
jgi:hypothetical protein